VYIEAADALLSVSPSTRQMTLANDIWWAEPGCVGQAYLSCAFVREPGRK
jgi:hypothetical protein